MKWPALKLSRGQNNERVFPAQQNEEIANVEQRTSGSSTTI